MVMKRVTREGKTLNQRTLDMLERAEARLGYPLHVIQGSYNAGGVSASAGTHDGGGALDVSATSNPSEVVRALREVGFAAWHRLPSQGPWSEHIHAIAIGDNEMSAGAATQVREYYAGQNGLASHLPDDGPKVDPIPVWPIKLSQLSVSRVRKQFEDAKPRKMTGIKKVQQLLNKRLNLNIAVDGVAGKQTRDAYKKWDNDGVPSWDKLKTLVAGYYRLVK